MFPRKQTALYNALIIDETDDERVNEWGLTEHLLASIYDTLNLTIWNLAGGKGKPPPHIPRPGINNADNNSVEGVKCYKGQKVTVEEARRRLANMTQQTQ